MADNTNRRGPEDPKTISLSQAWEVAYWTRELGVTEQQLRAAIVAVGNSTAAVRRYLGR